MIDYVLSFNRYLNLIGIILILAIAYAFSVNKNAVSGRLILRGLFLHFLISFIMLRTQMGIAVVGYVARSVSVLYNYTQEAIEFVFGNLGDPTGAWGFIFAVRVLPIVIFFGAFTSLLFYLGIIQRIVSSVSFIIKPILGTSGAETVCAIANSFLGQTEAPLVIRNYLPSMTKSEILVVMVSGMGTISGGILVVFAAMGVPITHLLSASVMAIPATIIMAKILYPETEKTVTDDIVLTRGATLANNVFEAIALGTTDGLKLALNVGAMLISFLALIALFNGILGYVSIAINRVLDVLHIHNVMPELAMPPLTLNTIFGFLMAPFGYLLGFTGVEAVKAGELLGTKISINELIAYMNMVSMELPSRTQAILTYALCGFSNFSCIGIQIGGIGALVPEKRVWLSELGLRALLGAILANLLSAMTASLLL